MRLHKPDLTLVAPAAKSQTHVPNGFHARFDSGIDNIAVLSIAFRSVPLTATDEQEQTDALQSGTESLRTSEIEFAELDALGFVVEAVRRRAGGGDDGGWVEVVGV
jgi:hypothetical protein